MFAKRCFNLNALVGLAALCVVASSCAVVQRTRMVVFVVDAPDSSSVRFEGKGAAAGMMMSSSMGSMGIAIGVAIDEGIAKDIQEALNSAGCKIDEIAKTSFQAESYNYGVNTVPIPYEPKGNYDLLVQIDQVKFRTFPSEQDLTLAEVVLTIDQAGVVYELASARAEDADGGVPLEEVRVDGRKACHLVQMEVTRLFDTWYEQQQR
jgi:hypothetical protein